MGRWGNEQRPNPLAGDMLWVSKHPGSQQQSRHNETRTGNHKKLQGEKHNGATVRWRIAPLGRIDDIIDLQHIDNNEVTSNGGGGGSIRGGFWQKRCVLARAIGRCPLYPVAKLYTLSSMVSISPSKAGRFFVPINYYALGMMIVPAKSEQWQFMV